MGQNLISKQIYFPIFKKGEKVKSLDESEI